ncbi:MAG: rhodanese-like domain-containing protein [Saprospiraceae bacterium]|nr:rhodanese-like domain-containing protein [Saprospiraceae bacterium]
MNDITVSELKERLDQGEQLLIIDVREPFEYEMYNIGAKLIPLGQLNDALPALTPHKDDEIILHCRSGMRSATAKHLMADLGFTKVRNLLGGMLAWQDAFEKI